MQLEKKLQYMLMKNRYILGGKIGVELEVRIKQTNAGAPKSC